MKIRTRKIMAMIGLLLILITSLPINAFATFITDINSNAQFGVISGSLANYGHELHYANYDGQTYIAFCTQYGTTSPNGSEYTYNGSFVAEYKNNLPQYERIAEMIYFGYTMNYGYGIPQSAEAIRAACCTQQYVWEYIHNNIDSSFKVPGRDSWNGNYMSTGYFADWTSRTEGYYNQYHGNTSFNGVTNKITLGQSTTLTDTNGRLSSYSSFTQNINGITFYHEQGSNDLAITVASDCTADKVTFNSRDYGLYQLMPNGTTYNSNTMSNYVYIRFTSGAVQNLIFSNYVDPSAFSLSVEVEYGNALLIKTNSVGNSLAGAKFGLYKDSNCTQLVRTGISENNGQIQFNRLAPMDYYVKELSVPTGYLLDNTIKKVSVKANETAEVAFKNNEPTGEIKLIKTDAETGNKNRIDGTSHHGDATIDGTEYTLYADEDIYNVAKTVKYFSANEEIATYTFDGNGVAKIKITTKSTNANLTVDGNVLKGLPMGKYYSNETLLMKGYLQDTEKHAITLKYKDMNTPIIQIENTFTNQVEKAKFEVIKVSSITNTTAPIVEGAEFTAILTKYVNYYGTFDEALKHLDEYSIDEYSIFKTVSNGHGISDLLAYGKYTVNETYCPSDEINPVKEFYVTIDKNSNGVIKELVENDTPFQSYLKMIKIDKKTGKKVTFSNATFNLYKLNIETNEWEKVKCKLGKETFEKWTTDEKGMAYTETKLDAGKYKLDEILIPTGFLELEEECIFEINRSNETLEYDKDYDAYITVKVKNEQPTGTLIVDKTVALREDIDTSLVDISDLSGIEFKLTAKEDILDMADGSVIYEKGKEVGTYNLTKEGKLKVENLPMGCYELVETKTLDGLVLDNTKYEIKFEQKDTKTKVYENIKEISNDTTCIEFSKTDITGQDELKGATLEVKDKDGNIIDTWVSGDKTHKIEGLKVNEEYTLVEKIQVEDYVKATDIKFVVENNNTIKKVTMIDKVVEMSKVDISGEEIEGATIQVLDKEKNVIDEWVSSKEPHKIKNLVEGEKYILHEEIVAESFVKATDIEFTVTLDKETQKLEMIDKIVEISKIDLVTGDELEGAKLQVTDEDGNIIDEWVSEKTPHKVVGLEEGKKYILTETTCPYGFEQAENIEFIVSYEKENQKIEMKDMPILKNIKVVKIDSKTKEVIKKTFTFGIYEDEQCNNLIKEIKSNKEDGYVIFDNLRYGSYFLKELKSPSMYELSDKIIKIEINDEGVFADGILLNEEQGSIYSFEFENTEIEVPNTSDGRNTKILLSLTGISAITLIAFGIYEYIKKIKNKE